MVDLIGKRECEKGYEAEMSEVMGSLKQKYLDGGISKDKANQIIEDDLYIDAEGGNVSTEKVKESVNEYVQLVNGRSLPEFTERVGGIDRPYFMQVDDQVNIGDADESNIKTVIFHEFAHKLESDNPNINYEAQKFILNRAKGKPESLRKMTGMDYDKSETAFPGDFLDPYVGRIYSDNGATEVISMGLEHFATPEGMSELYRKDPEHFILMLNILNMV